jgi:methylenetetrahydrofolate--tRNA-(uracil-5-)-methyltransferase
VSVQHKVIVVGAGLAGSEAAWQLAERGVFVHLYEMRPKKTTPAHHTGAFAELVCSNSLKSLDAATAAGTLKHELAVLGSFVLACALESRVPAGGALAVDRETFSALVSQRLSTHPGIEVHNEELTDIEGIRAGGTPVIIATGPLTSDALADNLTALIGQERLAFFDAAAPIVEADSLDRERLFAQSRYDKSGADYLNAPMTQEHYEAFIHELTSAQRVILKEFEGADLFQACQPVEEVARCGLDTLRYGALKPIGLTEPKTGRRPWAVVQLRPENKAGTAYNLVGFQTNLSFSEQQRVFRMIPGLEHAVFARYGVMHRNTFIDAPQVLDRSLALRADTQIRFAGQITGTEGYVEAIGTGLFAALCTYAQLLGKEPPRLPKEGVLGALLAYATDPTVTDYQPLHVNYGIMAPLDPPIKRKRERYAAYSKRALHAMEDFRAQQGHLSFVPAYEMPSLQ